jgi:hypothetical protein
VHDSWRRASTGHFGLRSLHYEGPCARNEATVQFKDSRFSAGSVRHRRLGHTWAITVSKQAAPGDHVIGVRDYGDFPPQLVR